MSNYQDDLLTLRDVARILRVDPQTVRRWVITGALEAVYLPLAGSGKKNKYRVKRSTINKILA